MIFYKTFLLYVNDDIYGNHPKFIFIHGSLINNIAFWGMDHSLIL